MASGRVTPGGYDNPGRMYVNGFFFFGFQFPAKNRSGEPETRDLQGHLPPLYRTNKSHTLGRGGWLLDKE